MILALLLWGLMATNNFDSGHVIVPIMHTSGDVHAIAVPEGTDMKDFHAALGDAGYHHDLPQPTREGAIEFSSAFRDAAKKAVIASHNFEGQESGFVLDKNLAPHRNVKQEPIIQTNQGGGRHGLKLNSWPDDAAALHTHPSDYNSSPSPEDVNEAKRTKKVMMVASRDGLWEVGPDGKPQQVFKSRTWYSDKEPK